MHTRLPDLMFPADETWLISALWDDAWWSFGGNDAMVTALASSERLEVRRVGTDADATPPGHVMR